MIKEKGDVFCAHCRFLKKEWDINGYSTTPGQVIDVCCHKSNIEHGDWKYPGIKSVKSPSSINADNDCGNFDPTIYNRIFRYNYTVKRGWYKY